MAEFEPITDEEFEFIKKVTPNVDNNFIKFGPKKFLECKWLQDNYEEVKSFEVRADDVWIVTLPRSGTTLTQEMVWQILNDFRLDNTIPLIQRYTYFELSAYISPREVYEAFEEHKNNPKALEELERLTTLPWVLLKKVQGPRYIKTHLPLSLLPNNLLSSGCKIVYVARNPKDMMVSRYHFSFIYGNAIPTSFELYWELLEKNLITLGPFWIHIEEAWQQRHQSNFLFLFYEDIVQKTSETIKQTSQFFQKHYTDHQIAHLAEHLKIMNFKSNPALNKDYFEYFGNKNCPWEFVRKGRVDGWKEELFTKKLEEKADKWIQENYKKTTLRFPNIK